MKSVKPTTPLIWALTVSLLCQMSCPAPALARPASGPQPAAAPDSLESKVISKGEAAGDYQAFPDATRLTNGDIVAVFYGGDSHVTRQNAKYPNAGRICLVRSKDEGKTWSAPVVIYDDPEDNRDPHISQLGDGTLMVSFFNLRLDPKRGEIRIVRSRDNGQTWDKQSQIVAQDWFCSAQVRELANGAVILPVYTKHEPNSYRAGFILSYDRGKNWEKIVRVDSDFMLNETDVVTLKDGSLYAALRGFAKENVNMHYTTSKDNGKTWAPVKDIGFLADSPSFTRLKSGEILMSYRGYSKNREFTSAYTAFRVSRDEGKSWQGPYLVDRKHGAYPSTIELKDGSVLMVYYEEGNGSAIRAVRFRKPDAAKGSDFAEPQPINALSLK